VWSLRTGLDLEDTSRTNFGGLDLDLGMEDAVREHIHDLDNIKENKS